MPLMEFLRFGTTAQKANAAAALRKLASSNDDNCEAIVRDGAIPLLEGLVKTGNDTQKQSGLDALEKLRPHPISNDLASVGGFLRSVAAKSHRDPSPLRPILSGPLSSAILEFATEHST
ncbi:Armadillo-type fold [Phytophthora cactorum]|nr:Armadillo-type fold [Phytophthora cactorum]